MTPTPLPLEPRLIILAGRLARLDALNTEAAHVTAGLIGIADELQMLPLTYTDEPPALPISTAYWAACQSVNALVAAGSRLLDEIEQERSRRAAYQPRTEDYEPVRLEQRTTPEAS
jgi:hypothetical protein